MKLYIVLAVIVIIALLFVSGCSSEISSNDEHNDDSSYDPCKDSTECPNDEVCVAYRCIDAGQEESI